MFSIKQVKQNLLGCLEITLFMCEGINRFDTTRASALKSFIIPLACLPIVLYVLSYDWDTANAVPLYSMHATRIIITMALFLGIIYMLSKQLGRDEHFYRFISAYNWITIPLMLFLTPLLFMDSAQHMDNYALFITMAGYVYTAFIATYCFKLPWELGTVIAILGMAIDQTSFDMGYYVQTTLMGI